MPEVPGRKVKRKELRYDRYTEKLAEALMATGDFASEADMIRTAIQTLYSKYEADLIPVVLQSRTMSVDTGFRAKKSRTMNVDTGFVAKSGEQEPLTVTRSKSRKSKAASKPEEELVEPV